MRVSRAFRARSRSFLRGSRAARAPLIREASALASVRILAIRRRCSRHWGEIVSFAIGGKVPGNAGQRNLFFNARCSDRGYSRSPRNYHIASTSFYLTTQQCGVIYSVDRSLPAKTMNDLKNSFLRDTKKNRKLDLGAAPACVKVPHLVNIGLSELIIPSAPLGVSVAHVVGMRAEEKVDRINAARVVAFMQDVLVGAGPFAVVQAPDQSVRRKHSSVISNRCVVAPRVALKRPFPASVFLLYNEFPKARYGARFQSILAHGFHKPHAARLNNKRKVKNK